MKNPTKHKLFTHCGDERKRDNWKEWGVRCGETSCEEGVVEVKAVGIARAQSEYEIQEENAYGDKHRAKEQKKNVIYFWRFDF